MSDNKLAGFDAQCEECGKWVTENNAIRERLFGGSYQMICPRCLCEVGEYDPDPHFDARVRH